MIAEAPGGGWLTKLLFALLLGLLSARLAGAQGKKRSTCLHGNWTKGVLTGTDPKTDEDIYEDTCVCFPGWRKAGPTDAIEFYENKCSQYGCTSDAQCRHAIGHFDAVCVVPGWNCLCGFWDSLESYFEGRDTYEDVDGKGYGGRCMGLLYYLSVQGSLLCAQGFGRGWYIFVGAAVLLLPFGQRRTRCTHREPSILNFVKRRFQRRTCDGSCVDSCSIEDDFVWSLKALELYAWYHGMLLVGWATCAFIWLVAVWMIFIVVTILMIIAGICFMLFTSCEGAGDANCDCNCDCEPPSWLCSSCERCCVFDGDLGGGGDIGYFYSGGSTMDSASCCSCECSAPDRQEMCWPCCHPLLFTLVLLPRLPQNALGGCFGRCLGTHVSQRREIRMQNPLIAALSFRWLQADQHNNDDWRKRVREFLGVDQDSGSAGGQPSTVPDGSVGGQPSTVPGGQSNAPAGGHARPAQQDQSNAVVGGHARPAQQDQSNAVVGGHAHPAQQGVHNRPVQHGHGHAFAGGHARPAHQGQSNALAGDHARPAQQAPTMVTMGGQSNAGRAEPLLGRKVAAARVAGVPVHEVRDGQFDKLRDRCVESTYEDYLQGTCWICCNESIPSFDLYTCGHIFCTRCSDTMLSRRMPCPLCRRVPMDIRRAGPKGSASAQMDAESQTVQ